MVHYLTALSEKQGRENDFPSAQVEFVNITFERRIWETNVYKDEGSCFIFSLHVNVSEKK